MELLGDIQYMVIQAHIAFENLHLYVYERNGNRAKSLRSADVDYIKILGSILIMKKL